MKDLLRKAFEAGQLWERYQYREIDSALDFETWCEQLDIPVVVGRSEQYHCELYDFGRKDKPCDKQCDGCKAMNLD